MEIKLRLLAKRLKEKTVYKSEYDGHLENQIAQAKQEIYNEIGDMIEEILQTSNKDIVEEIGIENL